MHTHIYYKKYFYFFSSMNIRVSKSDIIFNDKKILKSDL